MRSFECLSSYIITINYFGGTKIIQYQNEDTLLRPRKQWLYQQCQDNSLICSSNCWFKLHSKPSGGFIHSLTYSLPFTSKCCPAIYPDACYWRWLLSINFLCHLYGFYLFVFLVWNGARALLRWMDYNSTATTHQSSKFDFRILTQLLLSYYCATLSRSMAF